MDVVSSTKGIAHSESKNSELPSRLSYDELAAQLAAKEEQLKLLMKSQLQKGIPINVTCERILNLEQKINELEASQADLKILYSDLLNMINSKVNQLENYYQRLIRQHEKINHARLRVINSQKKILIAYDFFSIKKIWAKLKAPKIGILQHYNGRVLQLPKWYQKNTRLINPPCISIVTPSFNQGDYIEQTIHSVLDQKYPNLEYIIQDGDSTDNSKKIISSYEASLKHWSSQKDSGQSQAINHGFHHATGEIMAYLNSDDLLLPGALNYIANYFSNHPDVDVIYGHRILIDEYGQDIGRWILPKHDDNVITWADYIPQETLFWRRSIWDKAGARIDENFRFAMDWDLILRFKECGAKFVRLPRFLGAFRIHLHQKTSNSIQEIGKKEMDALRLRCHKRPISPEEVARHIKPYLNKHVILHKLFRLGILRY